MKRFLQVVLVLLLFSLTAVSDADTLVLKDGRRLQGRIVSRSVDSIKIELANGTQTFWMRDIEQVLSADEEGAAPTELAEITKEELAKEVAKTARDDVDALLLLALRAEASGLTDEATRIFKSILRAFPDEPTARKKLGYVRFGGEWTTADDVRRERNLERTEGGGWTPIARAAPAARPAPVAAAPKKEAPVKKAADDPNAWYDDHHEAMPWEEATTKKTKRYLIKSNIRPEYLDRYGVMLDQYFERFNKVFKNVMIRGTKYKRSLVVIYPSQERFMEKERVPKNVGGFYRPGDRMVVGYHGRFGKTGTTRTVVVHEGTHQFQHLVLGNAFRNCPIWLIEGLAVLFEAADWNAKRKSVDLGKIPRDRLEIMKRAVEAGKTIPLRDLFRVPKRRFTGFHYAHAWAVIYRLIYGTKNKKQRKENANILSNLFTMGRQKRVNNRDVERVFGGEAGLAKFEDDWKEWIKTVPYDYTPN